MKNLILSTAFSFWALSAFAQFSIGLSTGANYTYWDKHVESFEGDLSADPAMGFRTALLGEYRVNPAVTVRAEAGMQLKNDAQEVQFTDATGQNYFTGTFRQYFQFWEGSLLLQFSPIKKARNLYLIAGVTTGRISKAWARLPKEFQWAVDQNKPEIDLESYQYNRNALAADYGLGFNIRITPKHKLKLEGRFQHSLSNFSTAERVSMSASPLIGSIAYMYQL